MNDESPLEAETTGDTNTFEKFGRTWTVPNKRHHRHILETKRILRAEGALDADDVAQIYLSAEEYADLVELDVSSDELGEFADAVSDALGVGSSGNSKPSSASS